VTIRAIRPTDSTLARLSRSDRLRPWLLGLGALTVLVGIVSGVGPQGRR